MSAPQADESQQRLNYTSIPSADRTDISITPRRPFTGEDNVVGTKAVVGSIAGCAAAIAVAFYLVARDVGSLTVGIVSVLSGLVVGGIAALLVRRQFDRQRRQGLDKFSEWDG